MNFREWIVSESLEELDPEFNQALLQTRSAWRHNAGDEMFVDMHSMDWQIGQHFDAHGIAKTQTFANLQNLLRNGIDASRRFDTAPLSVDPEKAAGLGAGLGTGGGHAYYNSHFIVTSGPGETIQDGGIKNVIVDAGFGNPVKQYLQKAYPRFTIMLSNEAERLLSQQVASAGLDQQANQSQQSQQPQQPNQSQGDGQFSVSGYLQQQGHAPEDMEVTLSQDRRNVFARNRNTGKVVSVPVNSTLQQAQQLLSSF